ncbi:MAG: glycosyltransferase family 4 protein [Chlorobi bacterium]|nr:glycosyltransferase family 4 protein [Chlorobiota bacterium]
MKKICFVIPRAYYLFNPKISDAGDKIGGAQKQAYLLSTESARNPDFDIHFITADFGQKNFEQIKNVKLHKTFDFNENIIARSRKLASALKKINADIYIFRSASAGTATAAAYTKKILQKKVIYMLAHDTEVSEKLQRKHSGPITAKLMNFVYKNADIITSQTEFQAESFKKFRNRQTEIIKNIFTPNKLENLQHADRKTILWVGRLSKTKNPELLFTLAKDFPEEQFVMIAPVVRDFKKYGEKIRQKAEKIKNLTYIKYVSPDKIDDYYTQAKIYLITSESEGFSNTAAEAMKAKTPVLSFAVNPDNILNKYKCGLFAGKNIKKLYADFEKLIKNSELRKKLGENGADYIKNHHDKEPVLKKFEEILNAL